LDEEIALRNFKSVERKKRRLRLVEKRKESWGELHNSACWAGGGTINEHSKANTEEQTLSVKNKMFLTICKGPPTP